MVLRPSKIIRLLSSEDMVDGLNGRCQELLCRNPPLQMGRALKDGEKEAYQIKIWRSGGHTGP
jgi:hypothetical protein